MGLDMPLIIVPAKKAINIVESSVTLEFTNSMSFAEMNRKISQLGKYIPVGVVVTIQFANGTYTVDETLDIGGFLGGGKIEVLGNSADDARQLSKNVVFQASGDDVENIISIHHNSVDVYVEYIRFNRYSLQQDWRYGVRAQQGGSCELRVESCSFDFSNASYGKGVMCEGPSRAYVMNSYFRYGSVAVMAYHAAYITVRDSVSDTSRPKYGLEVAVFGKIRDAGSVHVQGSTANHNKMLGGQIVTG